MEVNRNEPVELQDRQSNDNMTDMFPSPPKFLPEQTNYQNPLQDHLNNFDIPSDPQKLQQIQTQEDPVVPQIIVNSHGDEYQNLQNRYSNEYEDDDYMQKDQYLKDRSKRVTEYSFVSEDIHNVNVTNISITNPQIIDKTLKSYVQYTVNTKDNYGNFQTLRRYKDFYALYQLLCQRWIGCYIPPIPSKKAVGNLNSAFIESRRKMLEYFLQRCYEVDYVNRCDEFQLFIKSPNNFHVEFRKQKQISIIELSQNFQYQFDKYSRYTVDPNAANTISDFMQELQQQLKNITIGHSQARRSEQYFVQFTQSFEYLNQHLESIRSRMHQLGDIDQKVLNSHSNPYSLIVYYFQVEKADAMATLKILSDRHNLVQQMNKMIQRKDRLINKLHGINNGRKSIQQLFSNKPKEHFANKTQEEIDGLDQQINAMQSLIDIVTNRILNHEIPIYQQNKLLKFEEQIKKYTRSSIEEFEEVIRSIRKLEINA